MVILTFTAEYSGRPSSNWPIPKRTAVVLGGTSLMGGKASMVGTVLGTMTIAVIGNGLILVHISPFFTQIVTGTIILIAIWMNTKLFSGGLRLRRKPA